MSVLEQLLSWSAWWDDVKLASLWIETLVFQPFPFHGSWVVPELPNQFTLIWEFGSQKEISCRTIMITNAKLIGLGLVKLKAVIGPAPIIKRLKWAYIFGPVYIIVTQRKLVIKAVHLFHPEKNSKKSLKGQNDHDSHAHNYRSVVNCLSKYMMFAQASEMQSSVRSAFLHDSVVPPFFIHSLGLPYCRQTCLWAWLNTSITNSLRCIIKIWTSHACCQCSELVTVVSNRLLIGCVASFIVPYSAIH